MLAIFALFYRTKVSGTASSNLGVTFTFGFEAGGSFNYTILTTTATSLLIGWVNMTEYDKLIEHQKSKPLYDVCLQTSAFDRNSKMLNELSPNGANSSFIGTIDTKGVYYAYFLGCTKTSFSITFEVFARNPNTLLDYRWDPFFQISYFCIGAFVVVVIVWLYNWFTHFNIQVTIHHLFLITVTLTLGKKITRHFSMNKMKSVDGFTLEYLIDSIVFSLYDFVFYSALVLASKGYNIVKNDIETKEKIKCYVYGLLFVIIQGVMYNVDSASPIVVLMLFAFFGLVFFYIREVLKSIENATNYILAHLISIANSGIDPKSTPIYHKYKIYESFKFAVALFFSLQILDLFLFGFSFIQFWASELSTDIIELIFVIMLYTTFRLSNNETNGYLLIETINNDSYCLKDIQGISVDGIETRKGSVKWHEGMVLPGPPTLIKSPVALSIDDQEEDTEEVSIKPDKNDI